MKYLAFSYCVTNRRTLCQQQFEAALRVDPRFELAPAERGHPIWKVHYERAKQALSAVPAVKGNDSSAGKSDVARKGDAKKIAPKKSAPKKSDASASDARTSDARTSNPKPAASAAKSRRKGAKDESKAPAAGIIDARPSPDQKPQ